jgi:hypothetical protein
LFEDSNIPVQSNELSSESIFSYTQYKLEKYTILSKKFKIYKNSKKNCFVKEFK